MIKEIQKENIAECVAVIKNSFATIAKEFNITEQNAPRYVAFAMTEQRMLEQYNDGRKMFAYFEDEKIVGFCSLEFCKNECELNNLWYNLIKVRSEAYVRLQMGTTRYGLVPY